MLVPTAAEACWYRVDAWRVLLVNGDAWSETGLAEFASRPKVMLGRESPSLLATILLAMEYILVRSVKQKCSSAHIIHEVT